MSVLSDIAVGASGVLGGILNASSAARANDISERQFRESMDFQKYQYEDMKQYNSAVNQISRLRQAGQNPSLAFGSPAAGQIGSVSSPSPGTQHPVDYSGIMTGAASIGQAFSQNALNDSASEANRSRSMKDKADAFNTLIRNYTQYDKDTADIYRLRKEGKLSEEQANSEIARRQPMIDLMRSEMEANQKRALLEEQQTRSEFERTAQEEARKQIMQLQLSREPDRLQAELNFLAAQSFNQYSQGFLARANKKSIEELTPLQKEKLSQEYFESFSREMLNKQNIDYLKKKGDLIDVTKWPQVGATIAGGIASGVLASVGLGKFVKGLKGVKHVVGFAK